MSTKKANAGDSILRLTIMAMLAALAIVIGLWNFPILPAAGHLKMDFANVPVLISTILFGPVAGLSVLSVMAAIQAFVLGGDGWVGFVMHLAASGTLVLVTGLICRHKNKISRVAVASVTGVIAQVLIMVPMSYLFYPVFFKVPTEAVTAMVFPIIIPFNLIKSVASAVLTVVIFSVLRPFLKKQNLIR